MGDLENIEGLSSIRNYEGTTELTDTQRDYINEILPTRDQELIIARIDEFSMYQPPQAIDSNPKLVALLGDSVECFDTKYLEAPSDIEQAEQISDEMVKIDGIDYQSWRTSSLYDKISLLQEIESTAARIEHRPSCVIECKDLPGEFGHYNCRCSPEMNEKQISESLKGQRIITISSTYLDNSYDSYQEGINTILHEGRHAYQEYNLYERVTHPSPGDLRNWQMNEFTYRYQPCDETYIGMKLYDMQPLETDANKFAIDVLDKFMQKI